MGAFRPQSGVVGDRNVSTADPVARVLGAAAGLALIVALAGRGPQAVVEAVARTWQPFAIVGAVVFVGWVGVRLRLFDRVGRRMVPKAATGALAAAAVLGWVFLLSGLTNLDVAVVAATPLALVISADRGLDGGLLALGVAQAANAGSVLLVTANLTTLLVLHPVPGGAGAYVGHVWLAWLLVALVTLAVLAPLAGRTGARPVAVNANWSLTRIAGDLGSMFVLASSLRTLLPTGVAVGTSYWSAALRASGFAAVANNLPAAAAIHVTAGPGAWGAVMGLAIGPNLLLDRLGGHRPGAPDGPRGRRRHPSAHLHPGGPGAGAAAARGGVPGAASHRRPLARCARSTYAPAT